MGRSRSRSGSPWGRRTSSPPRSNDNWKRSVPRSPRSGGGGGVSGGGGAAGGGGGGGAGAGGGAYRGRDRDRDRDRDRRAPTSLLVRNLPRDCRLDDLRGPFEGFGPIKDVYIPKDYYTRESRGFGFVEFMDSADASDAKFYMDKQQLRGRQITVVYAEENRKKPAEMRQKESVNNFGSFAPRRRVPNYGGGGYVRRRSPPRRSRGRSRSRSWSRSSSRSRSPSSSYGRGRSRSPPARRSSGSPGYDSAPQRSNARGRSPVRAGRSPYDSIRSASPQSPRRSRSPFPPPKMASDGPTDRSRIMSSVKM